MFIYVTLLCYPPYVVRDLGATFLRPDPETSTDEKLGTKPNRKGGAVGKSKAKKPKQSVDGDGSEEGSNKVKKRKKLS